MVASRASLPGHFRSRSAGVEAVRFAHFTSVLACGSKLADRGESGGRTRKAFARRVSNPVPSPSFGLSLRFVLDTSGRDPRQPSWSLRELRSPDTSGRDPRLSTAWSTTVQGEVGLRITYKTGPAPSRPVNHALPCRTGTGLDVTAETQPARPVHVGLRPLGTPLFSELPVTDRRR